MPKRGKRQGQGKQDDHEGRPPDLTLGSFLEFPDLPTSSLNVEKKNNETTREEKQENQTTESVSQDTSCSSSTDNCIASSDTGFETAQNMNPAYFIGKTKKGKLPLSCESRAKGKKATVISNVSGDATALLSELKRRAGCGGIVRDEGSIELQGDRITFLSRFLTGHPCLKPYKA